MKSLLSTFTRSALDLLFPMHCAGCRREGKLLCAACIGGLATLSPPYCKVCAAPNPVPRCYWCRQSPLAVDGIRAPFLFEGPIRKAIHLL